MEYRRSTYLGDNSIDEVFEGTPEEIARLVNSLDDEEVPILDMEKVVEYIDDNLWHGWMGDNKGLIRRILELEEDYMGIVGIIEE